MTDLEKNAREYCGSLPEDISEEKPNDPNSTWQRMRDDYWNFMIAQLNTLIKD